jgi:hypothetical protein
MKEIDLFKRLDELERRVKELEKRVDRIESGRRIISVTPPVPSKPPLYPKPSMPTPKKF